MLCTFHRVVGSCLLRQYLGYDAVSPVDSKDMAFPLAPSSPTLDDSRTQLFNCSFLDEDELYELERAVQIKPECPRKRARVDSSSTNLTASDDGSTAPNTPRMHSDFGPETNAEIRATAPVGIVAALVQEVVQEVVKNRWRVIVSMEFDGSDEMVLSTRISPQHESVVQEVMDLVKKSCRITERA
ncbi:hypothetical protein CDEST_02081 [Colletotrichum destructivum]|uniref:Uncharacterized protein n=1 Tax=Colletotrichum destructivum TaxID=34406 RepID=A0AAX4I145_9PEZI|nr:hypothetical protein CDEST_02081 [Colletotrichum destructivum]